MEKCCWTRALGRQGFWRELLWNSGSLRKRGLRLGEVQAEGGKRLPVGEFLEVPQVRVIVSFRWRGDCEDHPESVHAFEGFRCIPALYRSGLRSNR